MDPVSSGLVIGLLGAIFGHQIAHTQHVANQKVNAFVDAVADRAHIQGNSPVAVEINNLENTLKPIVHQAVNQAFDTLTAKILPPEPPQ